MELDHPVGKEPGEPRGAGILVARERELVLLLARDLPLLRHLFAVLAHRESGARLGDAGARGRDIPRTQIADRAQLVRPAAARHGKHQALQVAAVGERSEERRVGKECRSGWSREQYKKKE